MPMPELSVAASIEEVAEYDAIVVVTADAAALTTSNSDGESAASPLGSGPVASAIAAALARHRSVDKTLGEDGSVALLAVEAAAGGRVVVTGVGASGEGADVRLWAEAAAAAVVRARGAGASAPLLLLHGVPDPDASCSSGASFPPALAVALLGVLQALYEPLQAREHEGDDGRVKLEPVRRVGFVPPLSCACSAEHTALFVRRIHAIEAGKRLARDTGNSDPERMTPQRCAEYIQQSLEGLPVSVHVVSDVAEIERDYPLAYAVARGSLPVERHHPRILRLEYVPEGTVDETLLFSAKGIVYDTGGADIKTGGSMAGMHLDKAGACNIAGFLKTVGLLKPAGLRVVAELGFVRNSCGSDSYVSDEIVRSHAGKRVQVLNTDAEGRMVLSDMLSHLRERVLNDRDAYPNPRFFTCATLTGHASRAVGPYTIGMDNSVAHKARLSFSLQDVATEWGEPIEVSVLRREDFRWAKPKNKKADVLQMGTGPAQTRGHQYGASFLILSAGFDSHGIGSEAPLSYTHLDIAGSAAEASDYKFGKATAVPLVGLTARFVLPRPSTA